MTVIRASKDTEAVSFSVLLKSDPTHLSPAPLHSGVKVHCPRPLKKEPEGEVSLQLLPNRRQFGGTQCILVWNQTRRPDSSFFKLPDQTTANVGHCPINPETL